MTSFKVIAPIVSLLFALPVFAGGFPAHKNEIAEIEKNMKNLDRELAQKVASKNKTRDQARIEETTQRIIEIHSELISYRKDLDGAIQHIRKEHNAQGKAMNMFSDVKQRLSVSHRKNPTDPLQRKLNDLFLKVQSKYASFVVDKKGSEELEYVETVVDTQKGKRRSREAEAYLRKKSEVELKK